MKKPDNRSAKKQLQVHPEGNEDDRVDQGLLIDRVGEYLGIQTRFAAHPQPVEDRIGHEGQEHADIG